MRALSSKHTPSQHPCFLLLTLFLTLSYCHLSNSRSVTLNEDASAEKVLRSDPNGVKILMEDEKEKHFEELPITKVVTIEGIRRFDARLKEPEGVDIREERYLGTKRKSSTGYLNAEEEKTLVGAQESIVDDQIKRLISIRDDALNNVQEDNKKVTEIMEEAELLQGGKNVLGNYESDSKRGRSNADKVENNFPNDFRSHNYRGHLTSNITIGAVSLVENNAFLQRWKEQAMLLQEQIRNRTILQKLREQAGEVLPEIPKFTELQLLEALRNITPSKDDISSNNSYVNAMNSSLLTDHQLEIIRCAENLVDQKQRQSFIGNIFDCIRSLSVLNCMRIFVWPAVADNIPQSISQNFPTLPIEINVADWIQSNRNRSKSARNLDDHQKISLMPESALLNILNEGFKFNHNDVDAPTFIDPKNGTLLSLLTPGQVKILQVAEKILPGAVRREYSDRMFSCVRRFEYYSCVKYFAWPMVKQYYTGLPLFPEYQNWYQTVTLYPEYPIVPFPSSSEGEGRLPEIVEADATRMRKPETVIIHILRNNLPDASKIPTITAINPNNQFLTLIPPDQIRTVHIAEQFVPSPMRPEFTTKTFKCIQQYTYLSCVKYSMWPTVRQFFPGLPELPDFQGWIPELPEFPDFSEYLPQFPSFSDFSGITEQTKESGVPTDSVKLIDPSQIEMKIQDILRNLYDSKKPVGDSLPLNQTLLSLTVLNERQLDILRLTQQLVEPFENSVVMTNVFLCIKQYNDFVGCTRQIIWPTVGKYVRLPQFPENQILQNAAEQSKQTIQSSTIISKFPTESAKTSAILGDKDKKISKDEITEITSGIHPNMDAIPRTKFGHHGPVISVTGTRFVPIFTEQPEDVILSILQSIHSSSSDSYAASSFSLRRHSALPNWLTEQQENILQIAEDILPELARQGFTERLVECAEKKNFLSCSRDVMWPTLAEHVPRLPSFPNFRILQAESNQGKPLESENFAEPESHKNPFTSSEINVKTGQLGKTTVTITDTRFAPICTELPEAIILNILRTIQKSTPGLLSDMTFPSTRTPEFSNLFTEQQANIIQLAGSLLPEMVRPVFVNGMIDCVGENNFLECTRDVAWPAILQFFPRLPNFPNFRNFQNFSRASTLAMSSELPAISLKSTIHQSEGEISEILKKVASSTGILPIERSYLDSIVLPIDTIMTDRQQNILKVAENIVPKSERPAFVVRMLQCMRGNNFLTCMQYVSWPTIRQFLPTLSELPDFGALIPDLPPFPQIPELPSTSGLSGLFEEIPRPIKIIEDKSSVTKVALSTHPILTTPEELVLIHDEIAKNGEQSAYLETPGIIQSTGTVLGYAGQPDNVFINIREEDLKLQNATSESNATDFVSGTAKSRKRRSVIDLLNFYPKPNITESTKKAENTGLNITESELLQILINISKQNDHPEDVQSDVTKKYFIDTLNSTIRDFLTADQYEILKFVEGLNPEISRTGFMSRVIRCLRSLSFIRCMGIFVWPMISSNLPSIGFPSFPSITPFRRSQEETVIQNFFGMTSSEFEKELVTRRHSVESTLLDWYESLLEDKFEVNLGYLKVKGYGNGDLRISISEYREGRVKKVKDTKNMPSILIMISDFMEDMFDQNDKGKHVKKTRSMKNDLLDSTEYQILNNSLKNQDLDQKGDSRSINDDQLIAMFLDKIRSNYSVQSESNTGQYLSAQDAYNAFELLFGTKIRDRIASKIKSNKNNNDSIIDKKSISFMNQLKIVPLDTQEDSLDNNLKVIPLEPPISHDMDKDSIVSRAVLEGNDVAQDNDQAKNTFKDLLEYVQKYSNTEHKSAYPEIPLSLPQLNEDVISRKTTSILIHMGRDLKSKIPQMLPGIGFLVTFVLQRALVHARAAASMASMISNMALGSALFGMLRQAIFGTSTHPQIKYVYDNNKAGPGISRPYGYNEHYNGK
ncbi:uncharacterized protein LOC107270997 [Cephus cinctus]|uniref:Uncharacterized protein LOC107270997 n=1 Tax=Cephus cinctus TaxID=211228 RepID=A0AAJ7FPM2_CEPCN|nr:uncharacterized protein LOC107270997 [Cephus cinctus]